MGEIWNTLTNRRIRKNIYGQGMCHVLGRGVAYTVFCCRNQKGIAHLEDLGVDEKIILKCILKKFNGKAWNGSGLGQGKAASSYVRSNKLPVSIVC